MNDWSIIQMIDWSIDQMNDCLIGKMIDWSIDQLIK